MKALVTGGSGFIGSYVVDLLLEEGYQVRVLDSLQKPVHLMGKPSYLPKAVEFIEGEVTDPNVMGQALKGVDVVFQSRTATRDSCRCLAVFDDPGTEAILL